MKAQIIPYPPPPREVVVTMSEKEARELMAALFRENRSGTGLLYAILAALEWK